MKIAFNTANLVARVSGYRFELKNWGAQHQRTIAETDEAAWRAICRDIAGAGFRAVEVWQAHADPSVMTEERAAVWKGVLNEHGLQPVGYAGQIGEDTARVCRWLGIDAINGGTGGLSVAGMEAVCAASGVRYHFENHPERSVEEIAAKVGGGSERLGVCVDTGWLGTQSVDAPAALRALGPLVRHVHVKDVRAHGGHDTCPLGEGVVNIEGCLAALRDIGYTGWYSWEDEPEDRNPLDIAAASREYLERHLDA